MSAPDVFMHPKPFLLLTCQDSGVSVFNQDCESMWTPHCGAMMALCPHHLPPSPPARLSLANALTYIIICHMMCNAPPPPPLATRAALQPPPASHTYRPGGLLCPLFFFHQVQSTSHTNVIRRSALRCPPAAFTSVLNHLTIPHTSRHSPAHS